MFKIRNLILTGVLLLSFLNTKTYAQHFKGKSVVMRVSHEVSHEAIRQFNLRLLYNCKVRSFCFDGQRAEVIDKDGRKYTTTYVKNGTQYAFTVTGFLADTNIHYLVDSSWVRPKDPFSYTVMVFYTVNKPGANPFGYDVCNTPRSKVVPNGLYSRVTEIKTVNGKEVVVRSPQSWNYAAAAVDSYLLGIKCYNADTVDLGKYHWLQPNSFAELEIKVPAKKGNKKKVK